MSLTATLLLNKEVALPKGRRHTRLMDARRVREGDPANDERYRKNREIKAANVAAVLEAVRAGAQTRSQICAATGIGRTTVHFALHDLEDKGHICARPAGGNRKQVYVVVETA